MKTKIAFGLFTFIVIGLSSCSVKQRNQNDIVKINAEEYIKEKMNDPNSYEFVKLELIDSTTFNENIENQKDYYSHSLKSASNSLKSQERYKTEIPSMYDAEEVEALKTKIEKNEKIIFKIDSLASILANRKNEVASYMYIFTFRGNNALGAKILNEYIVQTDPGPDFKIINMTNDPEQILTNPNDFPGFKEIFEKDF
jgi:hypothetical protein